MMPLDPAKFQRLPKWAQDHITYLTRDLKSERAKYQKLAQPESIGETDTVVQSGLMDEPDVKLPNGSIIEFTVDGRSIQVRVRDNELEVRGYMGFLNVRPQVSNVVTITSTRF